MRRSYTAGIGDIGEAKAIFEFTRRGIAVLVPNTINIQYDLVIDCCNTLYKVQVKTTESITKDGTIVFNISHNDTRGRGISYTKEDTDLIFLYCVELDICCLLTTEELLGKKTLSFRINDTANNQRVGINYAKDFTIDKCFERMGYTIT